MATTLSVIIPVYNEVGHLRQVLEYIFAAPCRIEREWIVVDDCSTDGSRELLRELAGKMNFRLIEQTKNQGKGAAIIRGIQEAHGELILIQDADFEYDPYDIPSLLEPLIENRADVVYGSRFKKNTFQVRRTYHYIINRFLTISSNFLSGIYVTDMETCYKVFRSDLLKSMNLTSKRFGIEIELTAFIAKTSARIYELPISYFPRTHLEGKKISAMDGLAALWHLLKFNVFTPLPKAFLLLPNHYNPDYKGSPHRNRIAAVSYEMNRNDKVSRLNP